MEEVYIGTKIIAAEPMDECTFLKKFKGQEVTNQETRAGYKVRYEDGYVSWSPKETFERSYRKLTAYEATLFLNAAQGIFNQPDTVDKSPKWNKTNLPL
jgi:hypothetical protein